VSRSGGAGEDDRIVFDGSRRVGNRPEHLELSPTQREAWSSAPPARHREIRVPKPSYKSRACWRLTSERSSNAIRNAVEFSRRLPLLTAALDVVGGHHERYDGSGYLTPHGETIPLTARIFAAVDALDAMTTTAPIDVLARSRRLSTSCARMRSPVRSPGRGRGAEDSAGAVGRVLGCQV